MPGKRPDDKSQTRRTTRKTAVKKRGRPATKQKSRPPTAKSAADVPPHFSRALWLAEILKERIVGGTYAPGEHVREADLQAEFGFSNGPIREALQAVVGDGLAERMPWRGVRVVELGQKQILELFQVRLALLEYAAELAARQAPAEALAQAGSLKRSIDETFSSIEAGNPHPSFYGHVSQWLLTASGNETLHRVWDRTMLQTLPYVNASMRRNTEFKSRDLIHVLIDAIVAREPAAARKAARELTRQTLIDLEVDGTV